jgi:hypothetical protein
MLLVGGAQPAAAASYHTVTIKGTMTLHDYETVGSDEHRAVSIPSQYLNLSHSKTRDAFSFTACVGGEVSGYFVLHISLGADELVTYQPELTLYEGTSCASRDRDGYFKGAARTLRPNYFVQNRWIRVSNTAESANDWVRVDYEVHHDVPS